MHRRQQDATAQGGRATDALLLRPGRTRRHKSTRPAKRLFLWLPRSCLLLFGRAGAAGQRAALGCFSLAHVGMSRYWRHSPSTHPGYCPGVTPGPRSPRYHPPDPAPVPPAQRRCLHPALLSLCTTAGAVALSLHIGRRSADCRSRRRRRRRRRCGRARHRREGSGTPPHPSSPLASRQPPAAVGPSRRLCRRGGRPLLCKGRHCTVQCSTAAAVSGSTA